MQYSDFCFTFCKFHLFYCLVVENGKPNEQSYTEVNTSGKKWVNLQPQNATNILVYISVETAI